MRRAERFWRLGVGIALVASAGLSIFGCSDREEEVFEQVGRLVLVTPDTAAIFHAEPSLNRDGATVIFSTDWPFDPAIDEDKDARDIAVINLPETLDGYPITGAPDTIQAAQFRKVVFPRLESDGSVQFDPNFRGKSVPVWNPTNGNEFALVIQNANFLDRIYVCGIDLSPPDQATVTDHFFLPAPPPPDPRASVGWFYNDPAYSPDGRFLLFTRYFYSEVQDPDDITQVIIITVERALWVVDLGTMQEYRLSSGSSSEGEGCWSPNGRAIAFVSNRRANDNESGGRDIYVIDFDPSNPGGVVDNRLRQLTHSNQDGLGPSYLPEESFDPVWSPNGRDITFVSTRRNPTVSLRERSLWIMNADGSEERALVFTRYDDVNPAYDLRNSGRLVYASGDHPLPVWKGQRRDIWLLRDF